MARINNLYEILGINRDATAEQIRSAHRRIAPQYHPDTNHSPDAEARFREIQKAYETLSDAERRRKYDQQQSEPAPAQEPAQRSSPFGKSNVIWSLDDTLDLSAQNMNALMPDDGDKATQPFRRRIITFSSHRAILSL